MNRKALVMAAALTVFVVSAAIGAGVWAGGFGNGSGDEALASASGQGVAQFEPTVSPGDAAGQEGDVGTQLGEGGAYVDDDDEHEDDDEWWEFFDDDDDDKEHEDHEDHDDD